MKAHVTSFDVARLAQVSQSAVSRTFTPGASVSEATRQRVLEAAQRLGYRPNAHARSLITGRSRIVGLVLSYLENLFYPVALQRLAERLQADGYHLLLFVNDNPNADDLVTELMQYHVDGIVLAATTLSSALARSCADAGIPVVLFNRVMGSGGGGTVSSVRSDNVAGGRLIAEHLLAQGRTRIAFIAGNEESSTNLERERGFREGLAAAGQHIYARGTGNYDFEQAQLAARQMFSGPGDKPDAVFVASDHMAFAVLDTLRLEFGLRIPQDVAVVGYDNVPQAAWGAYQLTTVEQPVDPMVEATARLLQRQMGSDAERVVENVVVPVHLVQRASSAGVQAPAPVRSTARKAPARKPPARKAPRP